jgi:hypothetical protein
MGRQCGEFAKGCYEVAVSGAKDPPILFSGTVPISPIKEGRELINEALRSINPDHVISIIYDMCSKENLNKVGCINATF